MAVLVRVAVLVEPVAMAMGSEDGEGPREPYVTFSALLPSTPQGHNNDVVPYSPSYGWAGIGKEFHWEGDSSGVLAGSCCCFRAVP